MTEYDEVSRYVKRVELRKIMTSWLSITNHPFLLVYHKVHPPTDPLDTTIQPREGPQA